MAVRFVVAGLLVLACSHPVRRGDRDDTRGGAQVATRRSTNDWMLEGTVDASDPVDWVRADLPVGTLFEVRIGVHADGIEGTVYAVDGRPLATVTPTQFAGILETTVHARGPIYVRVARTTRRPRTDYTVLVERREPVFVRPAPPPECDPNQYDPENPACKDACDYRNPDPKNPRCCVLWLPCRGHSKSPFCSVPSFQWAHTDLWLPLGRDKGIHGNPTAQLFTNPRPRGANPDEEVRLNEPILLDLVEVHPMSSRWRLRDTKTHKLEWLHANTRNVRIWVPDICRHDLQGPGH